MQFVIEQKELAMQRLEECKVQCNDTLRAAMVALEQGACGIALVVHDDVLMGTLTDGDIRRALLAGMPLDSSLLPHAQRTFTTITPQESRAAVIELMQARQVDKIPVVDSSGKLVGLHLLRELVGVAPRENWAVIMAGGRGTRLGSITKQVPKPMLSVAGRPILERLVLHLVGCGVQRIFLSVQYLGHLIEDHFCDGARFGCQIEYLREKHPLGTAGSLSLLPEVPTHPVLVMNGDLVTQADIGAMLDMHAHRDSDATVGVRQYVHEVPFGCVTLDGEHIVHISEKPKLTQLVSAGIYVLAPSVVSSVAPDCATAMTTLLEEQIDSGRRVGAFEVTDDWIDVGQPTQLKAAREGSDKLRDNQAPYPRAWSDRTTDSVPKAA